MENRLFAADHQRVHSEQVDDLALSLVAPLGSYDNDVRHSISLRAALYPTPVGVTSVLVAAADLLAATLRLPRPFVSLRGGEQSGRRLGELPLKMGEAFGRGRRAQLGLG